MLLRRTRAVGCGYGCAERGHEWTLPRVWRPGVRASCTPSGAARWVYRLIPARGVHLGHTLREYGGDPRACAVASEIRRTLVATDLERFVSAPGRDELVKSVREQIDAAGVTYIYYQFISVTGRIMGKGVPAAHWESMARKGFQLVYGATANLFVDRARRVHRLRPRGRRARRPARARDLPGAAVGHQGRARLVHLLPRPRGPRGRRLVPHRRLPQQPQADPGRVHRAHGHCTCAPGSSPR